MAGMVEDKTARRSVSLDAPLAYAIFCAALGWFLYTWILTDAGWLQGELLAVPDALFANGNADGLPSPLSTILNRQSQLNCPQLIVGLQLRPPIAITPQRASIGEWELLGELKKASTQDLENFPEQACVRLKGNRK
jgi:hypothetical protein